MTNEALRYDTDKPRFDLLPPEALVALADHYAKGAKKYAERNWEKGMDWERCFASLQRHAWKWQAGEDIDEETGSHHMIAVAWNAIALYVYAMRKVGVDDRAKSQQPQGQEATPAQEPRSKGFAESFWAIPPSSGEDAII